MTAFVQEQAGDVAEALVAPWRNSIRWARTEGELVAIANGFLAEWSDARLADLPADLRPSTIVDGGDLVRWALLFAAADPRFTLSAPTKLPVLQMVLFFDEAYRRLLEVSLEALEGPA